MAVGTSALEQDVTCAGALHMFLSAPFYQPESQCPMLDPFRGCGVLILRMDRYRFEDVCSMMSVLDSPGRPSSDST